VTPERWEQVKSLFELALACAPGERASFLASRCGADGELRDEVESLLAAHDDDFLEQPAVADGQLHELLPASVTPGTRVGAYEVVRELGRGGMGAVYLAVRADREFRKRVAIKLIRHDMETAFTIRRFRNERQILATLEHPHIARLIDGGTTPEGMPYFVMEYVEGEPLHRYCEMQALPVRERLDLFLKVCAAVHYAHRRMIVHRDLKPGNVLVQKDGTPKLLDFGIAKLLDPDGEEDAAETTLVGLRAMTPAYASPEQKRGEPATIRSDIYSLGVILRELATGRRACEETTGTPGAADAPTAPADLARIAAKAMREAPEERYQSVEMLAADIERYLAGAAIPRYDFPESRQPAADWEAGAGVRVAVLPLRLLNPDTASDAYLGIGIADAVITKLSNVVRIAVRPTSAVMRYAGAGDPALAGKELDVDFVLEGRIHKAGAHVRVTVQLVRVRSGAPAWAAHFDEEFRDLLKLEDSISGQVALALIPQLTGEEQERLARQGTASPKAHEAYLRGRWHWNTHTEDGRAKALVSFMEAVAEDPRYARAHAGIADYYLQLAVWGGLPPGESLAAAKQSALKALEIDPALAEAHASLAFVLWAYDRDFQSAAHHFQMAIALNPDYTQAHHWFGLFNLTRGRPDLAVASIESARKLDPHSPILAPSLGFCLYHARQYDRAVEELRNGIRFYGDDGRLQELLAWCYLEQGRMPECLTAARRAVEISHRSPFTLCALSRAEAAAGNREAAAALVDELAGRARERYISPCLLGAAKLGLDRKAEALDCVEQSWRDHDWWVLFVRTSPAWAAVHRAPRFLRMVEAQRAASRHTRDAHRAGRPRTARLTRWKTAAVLVLAVCALLLVYGIAARLPPGHRPFETTRLSKITTNGTAMRAVISPDGRYVAYVANSGGLPALWLRTVGSPEFKRIAGPLEGDITSLNFTANGTQICFVSSSKDEPARGVLYMVPLSGGVPRKLMAEVPGPVSPSADGARLALLRANPADRTDDLLIANPDGSGERKIASRHYPDRFAWTSLPAWSADAKRLAVAVEGSDDKGSYVYLMTVAAADGSSRIIRTPRWQYVERIAWLDRDKGLVVIGQEAESSFQHIWYIRYPDGQAKRINNDLSDYVGVSLTADGRTLVSVQYQTLANLYVLRRDGPAGGVQITPGLGRYFDLAWMPDGRIVYASDASGSADIWMMNADGSGQVQLTSNSGRNYAPAVSPDGNWIVFHSNRSGNWNIWRMGADGADPRALTFDRRDSNWPHFTPEGKYVVYHHTASAGWNLWRVPLAGGSPVQLTDALSTHPAVSPKDGRIACWYSQDLAKPSWRLAVLPPEGGAPLRTFDLPPTAIPDTALEWTPSGDGITYVDGGNGASNLWVQPADGGSPRPLTSFTSGQIYSFDWSRDGRLVYSRGVSSSDVVMIRDVGQK
jgi:serine/threonine protein kinase/Tol biopolymer transport system component/tetratricopeptide (TPR) repeat protein